MRQWGRQHYCNAAAELQAGNTDWVRPLLQPFLPPYSIYIMPLTS